MKRDNQPGKLQFTFGISVGLNNIPTMLTIQKGNVQDLSAALAKVEQ